MKWTVCILLHRKNVSWTWRLLYQEYVAMTHHFLTFSSHSTSQTNGSATMPFEKWSTTDCVGKSALHLDKAGICHSRDRAVNQEPRSSVCWQFPEQNVDCRKKLKFIVVYLHLTETHQLYVHLVPINRCVHILAWSNQWRRRCAMPLIADVSYSSLPTLPSFLYNFISHLNRSWIGLISVIKKWSFRHHWFGLQWIQIIWWSITWNLPLYYLKIGLLSRKPIYYV